MNDKRTKSWELLQERGLELYEFIQQSLDPKTWDVPIESEGILVPLEDFKKRAKPRLDPYTSESAYSPSTVAKDALVILDALDTLFFNIRNRLEDSFKSILIVNEDMNEFVTIKETEIINYEDTVNNLQVENERMRNDIEKLQKELKKKELGLKPLMDIVAIRARETVKLYDDFKECLGDENAMKNLLPMFERDVEITKRLIAIKQKQVFESELDYDELSQITEGGDEDFLPPEQEDMKEQMEQEGLEPVDDPEMPEELREYDPMVLSKAKSRVDKKRKPNWTQRQYWSDVLTECTRIVIVEQKKR